jgi:nascent polypeptide-associated complex subunit alpha
LIRIIGTISRAEKKARKLMSKLGMEKVENVNRVTLRRGRNLLYVISNPDCFKLPGSDSYVVFGEAKQEDIAAKAAAQAAAFKAEAAGATGASAGMPGATKIPSITEEVDEGEVDMEGLEEKDVDLVATQANVSKGKAAAALKASEGDIVSAIMELTM